MDCRWIEERLSAYVERLVPEREMELVAEHLRTCTGCAVLYREMRSALAACQAFPTLDLNRTLVDKILLRTSGSGQSRKRSLREFWAAFWHPYLMPRFAAGALLAVLFLTLLTNVVSPNMTRLASALSPGEVFSRMDRRVQELYGEGLRAYEQKNRWQAEFLFLKDNAFNKIAFMIASFDIPVEGEI
jgi:hypothetical protein